MLTSSDLIQWLVEKKLLGNIWRFPYLAAKYGGGIFLLVYILLAVSFGFALMIAEIAIGRKTGLSAIGAFKSLNKK